MENISQKHSKLPFTLDSYIGKTIQLIHSRTDHQRILECLFYGINPVPASSFSQYKASVFMAAPVLELARMDGNTTAQS